MTCLRATCSLPYILNVRACVAVVFLERESREQRDMRERDGQEQKEQQQERLNVW